MCIIPSLARENIFKHLRVVLAESVSEVWVFSSNTHVCCIQLTLDGPCKGIIIELLLGFSGEFVLYAISQHWPFGGAAVVERLHISPLKQKTRV